MRSHSKKKFTRRRPVDSGMYSPDSTITQKDLVQLISQRACGRQDERAFKDRVRKRLKAAVTKGLLELGDEGFVFGKAIFWAKIKWPGIFDGLECSATPIVASVNAKLPAVSANIEGYMLPLTLADCHEAIKRLVRNETELKSLLKDAQMEIASLKPDAERYRSQASRGSYFGQQGGRGNKK